MKRIDSQPKQARFCAEENKLMTRRFVLVGLFFALTTVAVFCQFYIELTSPMFFNPNEDGFAVRQQVGRLVVGPVKPGGPAVTLQTGDEIVSVDGATTR